jgi:hypothetical protein
VPFCLTACTHTFWVCFFTYCKAVPFCLSKHTFWVCFFTYCKAVPFCLTATKHCLIVCLHKYLNGIFCKFGICPIKIRGPRINVSAFAFPLDSIYTIAVSGIVTVRQCSYVPFASHLFIFAKSVKYNWGAVLVLSPTSYSAREPLLVNLTEHIVICLITVAMVHSLIMHLCHQDYHNFSNLNFEHASMHSRL